MLVNSWEDNWNEIIRKQIFQDAQLKKLMKIPEGTNILTFIDRYFIRSGQTSSVISDQDVRIVYGHITTGKTSSSRVTKNEVSFDIYVKQSQTHNVGRDRLQLRSSLIADRLAAILTKSRYVEGYRFWLQNDTDLMTRVPGYTRRNISFGYMKVY